MKKAILPLFLFLSILCFGQPKKTIKKDVSYWKIDSTLDKMTDAKMYTLTLRSLNTVLLNFPYNTKNNYATITIVFGRKKDKVLFASTISIENGIILESDAKVKFNDYEPVDYKISESDVSNVKHIEMDFFSHMIQYGDKSIFLKLRIHDFGVHLFEFDSKGFEKYAQIFL